MEEWRCSTLLSDRAGIYFVNKLRKVAFCAQERSLKDKKRKEKEKRLKGLNGSFEFGSSETKKAAESAGGRPASQ